jgi:hypothetical protein
MYSWVRGAVQWIPRPAGRSAMAGLCYMPQDSDGGGGKELTHGSQVIVTTRSRHNRGMLEYGARGAAQ